MKKKIEEILRQYGWSQARLAEEIGVSAKTLSFWMSGKSNPRGKNIEKIDNLLAQKDVSVENSSEEFVNVNVKVNNVDKVNKVNSKGNDEYKTVKVQGILYNSETKVGEDDDDEGYYKNEMVSNEKRANYYRGKRMALIMEETNRDKLILFPSIGGQENEWYKVGGVSALIYKYRIGPRIGRKPNIKRDSDKRERLTNGIVSIHWLEKFTMLMGRIGYNNYRTEDYGLIIFELGQEFTEREIKELKTQAKREQELFQDTIKPEVSYPEIYAHYLQLARILPKKVHKMNAIDRDYLGRELLNGLMKIGGSYYRLADGIIDETEAKRIMFDSIEEMLAILAVIDAAELMPETGLLRIGTILADLKEATIKMLVKRPDKKNEMIGVLAKK